MADTEAKAGLRQPPIGGVLWPHEVGFLGLLAVAYYYTGSQFRGGGSMPLYLFGAALVAAVGVLIYRCQEQWRKLPNRAFFLILTTAWVLLFAFFGNATLGYISTHSLFAWLFDIYTSPLADDQHGLLIPFVVLVLFWWRRNELVAGKLAFWWPASLVVLAALATHLLGFVVQETKLSLIAFLTGLFGLAGLAWGRHWMKTSLFPFLFLLFCYPAGDAANWLTLRLRLMVSWIVYMIGHLGLAPDLVRDGTQIFDADHTFAFEVAAACSGIHSMVALLALTTIYGFIHFKNPWKRFALILSAVPLAVAGNVVRLSFTIFMAETFGQDAGKAVENKFGFITILVAILCMIMLSRWLENLGNDKPQSAAQGGNPV